ncbi:hypothetical protein WJX81_006852 [Elliptochloris bilobata]|uniref:Uncharacterized protein n=1 Tax=Elliptochloris bilobata TaxID=381761 RepID=A0AAW1S9S1_9CHLO
MLTVDSQCLQTVRVRVVRPKDAFVPGSSLTVSSSGSNPFDQGTVCNAVSTTGYFFMQTSCKTFPAVTNQPLNSFFAYRSFGANGCDGLLGTTYYNSGHSVSRVVAAIIVVAVCVVIGLCVFGAVAAVRRRRAMKIQQVQMQQFPPQGPGYGGRPQAPYGGAQGPNYNSQTQYNSAAPGGGAYGQPYSGGPQHGAQPYGAPYSQPYGAPHSAEGKPVQGVPVGGQPGGSNWHTDTSPGTYGTGAPANGQGRPPAV